MTRGGMLDVVLADDDEPEAGGGAGPGSGGPGGGRVRRGRVPTAEASPAASGGPDRWAGRRRRPTWTRGWLAVGAAVVLAAAGAGVVQGRGSDDRAARLAEHPGVLGPLDGPLRELWRAPGGAEHTVTMGGDLVVATFLGEDGHVLVGVDATTGAERWTAPLPEVSNTRDLACVTVPAVEPAGARDVAAGADGSAGGNDPPAHVVCRVVTALASLADGGQGFAASHLLVLDARTGARVDERPLAGRDSALVVAGTDLVRAEVLRDGHGSVAREDPVTGRVLWTLRTAQPLPRVGGGAPVLAAQVQRGTVVADGSAGWALTPAGYPRGEWHPQGTDLAPGVRRAVDVTVLPEGRFAVTDATTGGPPGRPAGTVTSSDTRPGFPIPGRVLRPVVDDGSAPDVLLTVPVGAGQVVAVDLASGRELWRADVRVGGQAILLDGRLVVMSGRGVRALDVGTGDVVWAAAPDVVPSGPQLLTDGEVVLVPVLARGAEPTLVALGIRDGGERWRLPVPAGVREYEVSDGRLLALPDRETVAFG